MQSISIKQFVAGSYLIFASIVPFSVAFSAEPPPDAIEIGSRLELMIDNYLIDSMTGVVQRLHHPVRREIALVHDASWEGNAGGYHTVFYDRDYKEGGRYRMYYHAWHIPAGTLLDRCRMAFILACVGSRRQVFQNLTETVFRYCQECFINSSHGTHRALNLGSGRNLHRKSKAFCDSGFRPRAVEREMDKNAIIEGRPSLSRITPRP